MVGTERGRRAVVPVARQLQSLAALVDTTQDVLLCTSVASSRQSADRDRTGAAEEEQRIIFTLRPPPSRPPAVENDDRSLRESRQLPHSFLHRLVVAVHQKQHPNLLTTPSHTFPPKPARSCLVFRRREMVVDDLGRSAVRVCFHVAAAVEQQHLRRPIPLPHAQRAMHTFRIP